MNEEESKVKVRINYCKSFLKVSPKTIVDYYNDFKLHQSSPSSSAFKFSRYTQLNCQEIVYLAKINEILDYIFTGGLEMPNLMTGISSHASTQPYAYYMYASKSWDLDAPLRFLTLYAKQFDKWMKFWRNFFSCSILDTTKPVTFLSLPPPSALEVRID